MKPELDLARFEELATSYGAQLERWPESERSAAAQLLQRSSDARQILALARAFDETLDSLDVAEPSAALAARVRAIPARHEHSPQAAWWPFQSVWRPVLALVTSLVLGVLSGLGTLEDAAGSVATQAAITTTPSAEELSAWAFGWDWEEEEEEESP